MNRSKNFDTIYKTLCIKLLDCKYKVYNTRELNNVKFELTDINNSIVSVRDISVPYLCAELIWYLSGSEDMNFISKFGSLWNQISDDGKTSNSAYGHIIQTRYGFNQLDKMYELLKKDPNSRRAVININVPNENVIETKDEPCTICLQFLLRNKKLHCTTMMRSNDMWFGLPYDIIFFTTIQKILADRLNVGYGTYTHFATSLHAYNKDMEKIAQIPEAPSKFKYKLNHKKLSKDKVLDIYKKIEESDDPKKTIVTTFYDERILV